MARSCREGSEDEVAGSSSNRVCSELGTLRNLHISEKTAEAVGAGAVTGNVNQYTKSVY